MPSEAGALRVVLVDDEDLARRVLREYLEAMEGIEVVAECANGYEGVKAIHAQAPDLVFLDIRMPKLDGFEVLEMLEREVAVVFVTAFDEHALRAFEVHAVDYLLKPFSVERLAEAVGRARARVGSIPQVRPAALAAAARTPGQFLERVLVRDSARVHVLPVETLDAIEAQDDYVSLKVGAKSFLKQQTLAEIETTLDPGRFVRVHRSWILNLDRLARIELYAKDSRVAILKDGSRVPVSRVGYQRLRDLL